MRILKIVSFFQNVNHLAFFKLFNRKIKFVTYFLLHLSNKECYINITLFLFMLDF